MAEQGWDGRTGLGRVNGADDNFASGVLLVWENGVEATMSNYEVPEPILNAPFSEPAQHWYIEEGREPELREGRRPAVVFPPRDQQTPWNLSDGTLAPSREYGAGYELVLVNRIRQRVQAWRDEWYAGATGTTQELMEWWRREGREKPLFYAQLEAAETILFLNEARADLLQGINVPREELSAEQLAEGKKAFLRYACKMATGSGKTTVMGMLAAWSMLNKVYDRGNAKFSDTVLVICPNVTIRNRLQELDPQHGPASIYWTRDLVPPDMRNDLKRGRVLVMNWHVFQPQALQSGGTSARVHKAGIAVRVAEKITIGAKTTTARGSRYLTQADYEKQVAAGLLEVVNEERDKQGQLSKVSVLATKYVKSDTALIQQVLGREVGGKQNILVFNDEAHHAYRIRREQPDEQQGELFGDEEEADEFFKEATVWIEGLDKVHKLRGINFCVDLSATPYYLGRVGQDTNRPFPWVVSDFGLIDAIESGLTKIPQLVVRDPTGAPVPGYFNIWNWIMERLTATERGARRASPKPEAILRYANIPIAMLAASWREELERRRGGDDPRPPVFILVAKNTAIAKVLYEWIAEDQAPTGVPRLKIEELRNTPDAEYTIRVDSKVIHETDDLAGAKSDEQRWMRFKLDTVGRLDWPRDGQGRPQYPPDFAELAEKLQRPKHPPGRDVRCIISVGMLTEGWDCNTVTHIVGLRPFMSQLLCEQVVGRALRRTDYELNDNGKFNEELAKVFGVPFEVIPFKATQGELKPPKPRRHVFALPGKAQYEIRFPRVEGYTQAVRSRIAVKWDRLPKLVIDPLRIPPEVEMKGLSINNQGRHCLTGPGRLEDVTLSPYRRDRREQEAVFEIAAALTKDYLAQGHCEAPAHVLFPQLARVVERYVHEKVSALAPSKKIDVLHSPYYGWVIETLVEHTGPDESQGETAEVPRYESNRGPGSTADVDYWTTREDVREAEHCHLNYVVPDTLRWEQSATYFIDKHAATGAFVKNAGLGFAIPYFYNGQKHDYIPDFIVRLKIAGAEHYLILETKGFDPLEEVKRAAAERWVAAVNADGSFGQWQYKIARLPSDVPLRLDEALAAAVASG